MKPKNRNNKGNAAIEFAIVLPVLLLIIFGIIEFSIILYDKAMISYASRQGTRAAIVFTTVTDDLDGDGDTPDDVSCAYISNVTSEVQAAVNNALNNKLISLGGTSTYTIDGPACDDTLTDKRVTVTVKYKYYFLLIHVFVNLFSGIQDYIDLEGVTVMRMENQAA